MDIEIKITDTSDGCSVKIAASDSEVFKYAIENLKEIIPPVYRTYNPNSKTWTVTDWAFLRDWVDDLSGKYQVETNLDELKNEPAPAQSIASPFQTLYLLPNAPLEVVKASYRALAKLHHPDVRGDSAKMIEINRAYETLTQEGR